MKYWILIINTSPPINYQIITNLYHHYLTNTPLQSDLSFPWWQKTPKIQFIPQSIFKNKLDKFLMIKNNCLYSTIIQTYVYFLVMDKIDVFYKVFIGFWSHSYEWYLLYVVKKGIECLGWGFARNYWGLG